MRFGGVFRSYLKSSLDSSTHSNELVNQMDSNLYKMWQWFWETRKSNSKVKGHKVSVLIILEISSQALTTNYFVQFEISRYLNLYEHQWIIIYFTRSLVTGVTYVSCALNWGLRINYSYKKVHFFHSAFDHKAYKFAWTKNLNFQR